MGALAVLLQNEGYIVTGSDGHLYPPMSDFLDTQHIRRVENYNVDNLMGRSWGIEKESPDIVIVGNAISRGHPEADFVETLVEQKLTQRMSFAQALAHFGIRDRKSFVVSGTHGKTSASTQMSWALESLGKSPGFFIGGIPGNFEQGCRMGDGNCFVSEGDEYDTAYWDKESKFLHYKPTWVLCTGIEFDHVDIYENLAQIEASFHKLITKTKTGWVIVDEESAPNKGAIERLRIKLQDSKLDFASYGESKNSEYRLLSYDTGLLTPEIPRNGTLLRFTTPKWGAVEVLSPLSGKHNALNSLGIIACLIESGEVKHLEEIQKYLHSFKGVKRRQEEIFVGSQFIVIDDFAHHPTAIRETILAIKNRYPEHKVAAFFEPRSASSARNVFQQEFATCFKDADSVFLSPPTKTNVPEAEKLNTDNLKKDIEASGPRVVLSEDVNELSEEFFKRYSKNDKEKTTALIMSNGSFSGLHKIIVNNCRGGNKSGQTTVEYILFLALILGVSLGVFHNIIFKKMDEIQATIAAKTSEVMSQNTMGIPINWFELEGGNNDAKIASLSDALGGNGQGVNGNGPNGGKGPGEGPGGGPDGGGPGGEDGKGGKDDPNAANRSRKSGAKGSSGAGAGAGGGANSKRGAQIGKGSGSSDDRGSVDIKSANQKSSGGNSSGGVSGADSGGSSKSSKGEKGDATEEKKEEGGTLKKSDQRFDGRKVSSQEKGCQDMDLATILKLLGSIGVILIGAIVMLSGRGGGKNAK